MDMLEIVSFKRDGGRLETKLTHPPDNLITTDIIQKISDELEKSRGDEDLKLITFNSGLPGKFSLGFDFKEMTPENAGGLFAAFGHLLSVLNTLPAISLVEVDGVCYGGGLQLAAYCDLIFASDSSIFGHPEVNYGIFPPVAAALYPHLIGRNKTLDLLITGKELTAEEALRIGLLTSVWPSKIFPGELEKFYRSVEAKSAFTLHLTKKQWRKLSMNKLGWVLVLQKISSSTNC